MKNKAVTIAVCLLALALSGSVSAEETSMGEQFFAKNLRYGVRRSTEVVAVQEFLKMERLYKGPVTGNYLSLTRAAVRSFQRREKIKPVNGVWDVKTRARANEIMAWLMASEGDEEEDELETTPDTGFIVPPGISPLLNKSIKTLTNGKTPPAVKSPQIEIKTPTGNGKKPVIGQMPLPLIVSPASSSPYIGVVPSDTTFINTTPITSLGPTAPATSGTSATTTTSTATTTPLTSTTNPSTATSTTPTTAAATPTGVCQIRNDTTSVVKFSAPDLGTGLTNGYAKVAKPGINTIDGLRSACTQNDYDTLLAKYCTISSAPVYKEVVVYDSQGNWQTTGGASISGNNVMSCPTASSGSNTGNTTTGTTTNTTTTTTTTNATPADTTAPVISNVQGSSVTETGATITWTTDESSTSQVEYATVTLTSTSSPSVATGAGSVTSHTVNLTGLTGATTYYFRVVSTDAAGNTAKSSQIGLTTTPPTPSTTWNNVRLTNMSGGSVFPSIAPGNNDYGIVWSDDRSIGEPEIYFVKVDVNGKKLTADLKLSSNSANISSNPKIFWSGYLGEWAVVWEDYPRADSQKETAGCSLEFARLSPSGALLGAKQITKDNYGICPGQADINWIGNTSMGGGYGVVWRENRAGTETNQIYFAKLDQTGSKVGSDVKLTQATGNRGRPHIVGTNDNTNGYGYAVVWNDDRDGNNEVYYGRLNLQGTKIGSELRVTETPDNSYPYALRYNGFGYDLLFADNLAGTRNLYLTRLNLSGSDTGSDYAVSENVAMPNDGGMTYTGLDGAAWEQSGGGIYFRTVNPSDGTLGTKVTVATGSTARSPSIASLGNVIGYAVVWMDSRDGNSGEEIYFANGN